MTSVELYAAFVYAYSLNPEFWQYDYEWVDFVSDSDHSGTIGLEVFEPNHKVTVDEKEACELYNQIKPYIDEFGLDEFYENCFGYLYRSSR